MLSEVLPDLIILLVLALPIGVFLVDPPSLLPGLQDSLPQILLLLQVLLIIHTFLNPGPLLQLQLRLSLCYVKGVDDIGEMLVDGVVLQGPALGTDSHVDGDCVAF